MRFCLSKIGKLMIDLLVEIMRMTDVKLSTTELEKAGTVLKGMVFCLRGFSHTRIQGLSCNNRRGTYEFEKELTCTVIL